MVENFRYNRAEFERVVNNRSPIDMDVSGKRKEKMEMFENSEATIVLWRRSNRISEPR